MYVFSCSYTLHATRYSLFYLRAALLRDATD